ncbi:MAG: alpha/beta hydrolase, partial [Cyanobacteria bacterium]|nr:alpha/beta hydrolase [Cyanobacteriota bacterium]MDW8202881.1 alpha/beta hydrolase [Cyanobacteriota bacterium SKYGB_h_bin112]
MAVLVGQAIVITASPSWSAERIKFFYPPFGEFTVSVTDLEIFAKEGRITPDFAFYAQQATPAQLEAFRELLQRQFVISPVTISQVAYSPTGDVLLDRLGNVIRTEAHQNGSRALRAAFILAAAEPNGLNVVELLRKFPSRDIRLDLPQSLKVARSASEIFQRRDQVLAALKPTEVLPPPDNLANLIALQKTGPRNYSKESLAIANPQRSQLVPVDLYMPLEVRTPVPLIVISHGIASDRTTFAYLARHLASYGFAVAALEHPETSSGAFLRFLGGLQGSPNATDIVERPSDITYLLDYLQLRAEADPARYGRINLQQVGVLGQSFGGYTALAVGGATINAMQLDPVLRDRCSTQTLDFNLSMLLQCRGTELPLQNYDMRDDRVKAVFAINPIGSALFGRQGMEQVRVPTLMIAGTDDYFAPPVPEQLFPFSWMTTNDRYLVIMDRGTHFSFLGQETSVVFSVPDGLIGPNPTLAHPYLKSLSLAFFL